MGKILEKEDSRFKIHHAGFAEMSTCLANAGVGAEQISGVSEHTEVAATYVVVVKQTYNNMECSPARNSVSVSFLCFFQVLLDLGISSPQLDGPRGFRFENILLPMVRVFLMRTASLSLTATEAASSFILFVVSQA